MSEDTDERMDRARRIREMREGDRPADESSDDQADGERRSDGDADADAGADDGAGKADAGADDGSEAGDVAVDPEAAAAAKQAAQAAAEAAGGGESAGGGAEAVDAGSVQGPTGLELPDQEALDAAVEGEGGRAEAGSGRSAETGEPAQDEDEEEIRVLEFELGGEYYCLDITYVEEIVKRETVTRVPNTPDSVAGVVDLRGQITTILDPKDLMDIDREGSEQLIVVFAPEAFEDQGAIGWLVDEVRQVVPIVESEVSDPPVDETFVHGVVDREDEFVIWVDPGSAIAQAAVGDDAEDS